MAVSTRPVGLPDIEERTRMRVQVQFDRNGDEAQRVRAWMASRFDHLDARASAQPGLCVSLRLPRASLSGFETWHARLVASLAPVDVALELMAQCLDDLQVEPARLVSMHVTD